jgi:hypothetical protein
MLLTAALALTTASSAFTPTITPAVAHPDVNALIDKFGLLAHEKSDVIKEKLSGWHTAATSVARTLYMTVTPRGRKLQSLDTWTSDLATTMSAVYTNPSSSSFQDALTRFQSVTCDGSQPKSYIVTALDTILQDPLDSALGTTSVDVASVVTPPLQCACSGSWDLTSSEWTNLWSAIIPLLTNTMGDDPNQFIETLVPRVKAVVPLVFGSKAMCSSACRTAMSSTISHAITLAQTALPAVTFPQPASTDFPSSSVACMCGHQLPPAHGRHHPAEHAALRALDPPRQPAHAGQPEDL